MLVCNYMNKCLICEIAMGVSFCNTILELPDRVYFFLCPVVPAIYRTLEASTLTTHSVETDYAWAVGQNQSALNSGVNFSSPTHNLDNSLRDLHWIAVELDKQKAFEALFERGQL